MGKVIFKNNETEEYIKAKLNKKLNEEIEYSMLKSIKVLTVNSKNVLGENIEYSLENIDNIKNLEVLIIKNIVLSKKDIKKISKLSKLKKLFLIKCTISEKCKLNRKIEKLYVDSTLNLENLKFSSISSVKLSNLKLSNNIANNFKKIEELKIVNCSNLEGVNFIKFSNVKKLSLNMIKMNNIKILSHFKKLKELDLDGSSIEEDYNSYNFIMDINVKHNKICYFTD